MNFPKEEKHKMNLLLISQLVSAIISTDFQHKGNKKLLKTNKSLLNSNIKSNSKVNYIISTMFIMNSMGSHLTFIVKILLDRTYKKQVRKTLFRKYRFKIPLRVFFNRKSNKFIIMNPRTIL